MNARILLTLAAAILVGLAGTADLRAQDRTLTFKQMNTGEELSVTYMRNGRYDPDGLKRVNYILRDWRNDETIDIDPRLIDLLWEVRREAGSQAPVQVFSGYRSPATNEKLRARSRGVARKSQHIKGRALDFRLPDVSVSKLREIALRYQAGGVGFYANSRFVHIDTARVRSWPRLSRQQLENLFPDGKTLHLPADGKPLSGYQEAKAAAEAGTLSLLGSPEETRMASRNRGRGLLAALFGGGNASGDPGAQERSTERARQQQPRQEAPAEAAPEPAAPSEQAIEVAEAPLPQGRPAETEAQPEPDSGIALAEAPVPPRRPVAAGPARIAALPPERPSPQSSESVPPSLTAEDIDSLTALSPNRTLDDELPFANTFTDAGAPSGRKSEAPAYVTAASTMDAPELSDLHHPDQSDFGELLRATPPEAPENRFEKRPPSFVVAGFAGPVQPETGHEDEVDDDQSWGLAWLWSYLTRS